MHLKLLIVSFCALLAISPAMAQDWSSNAYGEALCGAVSCLTGSEAAGLNPAGVALSDWSAGIGYSDRFMMKELSQKSARITMPVLGGVFTPEFNYYGFALFNTSRASVGYAKILSKTICAGINLNFHNVHIDDSPTNANTVSGDFGIICRPTKSLTLGTYIRNISNSQYSGSDTIIPAQIQVGAAYNFNGGHAVCVDIDHNSLIHGITAHIGIICRLRENFRILAGVSSQPMTVGVGSEFSFKGFALQFAARRNQYLGWIPAVSVCWRRSEDKPWER
ncbi:MAG: hypothetical protein J6T60_14435 [Bacteroidales bacterium]|nr:hypothetical protein [Bacteroidales bacterium]